MIINRIRINGGCKFRNFPFSNRILVRPSHGVLNDQIRLVVGVKKPSSASIQIRELTPQNTRGRKAFIFRTILDYEGVYFPGDFDSRGIRTLQH